MNPEQFVAHRGYQAAYPENTLIGVEAALDAGARWVEIDIQFSSDGVPVVVHDPDLSRISTSTLKIAETPWSELRDVDVGEPARFGSQFDGTRLCRLRELLALVARYPKTRAFVEIKHHGLAWLSAEQIAERVLAEFDDDSPECPIISFDPSILLAIKAQSQLPIGLVLTHYNAEQQAWLQQHQPQWVFCNYQKAQAPLWQGNWQWVIYPVNEVALAQQWLDNGSDLIETDDIGCMLDQSESDST